MKKKNDSDVKGSVKVKCVDCVNSFMPTDLCFMESCSFSSAGYCLTCPCKDCDSDCMNPEMEKSILERPKFKRK